MPRQLPDLRTVFLALFAWAGALAGAGHGLGLPTVMGVVLVVAAGGMWRRHGRGAGLAFAAGAMVFGAVATAAGVRYDRIAHNPLTELARTRAGVVLTGVVTDDPRSIQGRFGVEALVRLDVRRVEADGRVYSLREPVLVFGRPSWLGVPLGASVRASGHLAVASGGDVAAVLSTSISPDIRAGPDPWWRASARVRAAVRESVSRLPPQRRALVPALVDGDETGLDPVLADDFRTTGLTHLLAVSGTNLTLVVGFALVVARWCHVRGRWLYVVGAAGIIGFVLVARAEPSVLRAATMGTVALVGMGTNGADRGLRALGVATMVLLLRRSHVGVGGRFRAVGPRHRRHPPARTAVA